VFASEKCGGETSIGADGMNEGLGMGNEMRMVEHKSDCEHFISFS
jgi:hypothetical protein